MTAKRILIQACHVIVILHFTHTYVLLTANLDDFRSIAKKLIPNKLADQLTEMASHSMKYRQKTDDKSEYDDDEDSDKETQSEEVTEKRITPKKRFAIKDQAQTVDFDELVHKVRQQIENDNKNKFQSQQKDNKSNGEYVKDFSDFYEDPVRDKIPHKTEKLPKKVMNKKKLQVKHTDDNYNYKEDNVNSNTYYQNENFNGNANKYYPKEQQQDDGNEANQTNYQYDDKETDIIENDEIFKAADLTKPNDSYEDYVTPKRDDVFESDSETTATERNTKPTVKSRFRDKNLKAFNENEKYEYDESRERISEEVKAKTESLSYQNDGNQKKLKGTMIPTREYYKMSSPNYYANLPAVAEKYDFNEPLPERDREPENLTYFSNPPASINKKVKLLNA